MRSYQPKQGAGTDIAIAGTIMGQGPKRVGRNTCVEIFETPLPGMGVRYEFTTEHGRRIGVLVHRDARRDLLVYSADDLDTCSEALRLTTTESASLVELLGGTKITERLTDLRHEVEGLSIEWVSIKRGSPLADCSIGDGKIRTLTGASVVAILRDGDSYPGPGPDFMLRVGDLALVIGSIDGVARARTIIAG